METEKLDLVDENDSIIGQIDRVDALQSYELYGGFVRVVDCFLINSNNELWVPVRSQHKTYMPTALDFSVGEHVQSGETYEKAIIRGFQEEINLTPDKNFLKFYGVTQANKEQPFFQGFFTYQTNITPSFNPDDFSGGSWININTLLELIKNNTLAKPNIKTTINKYLK